MRIADIPRGTHMCLIYSDSGTADLEIAAFLARALLADGHGHYFHGSGAPESMRQTLRSCGCPSPAVEKRLAFSPATDVYIPDGSFSAPRMWQRLVESHTLDQTRAGGPIHYVGDMGWAADRSRDVNLDELIRYERGVNPICVDHPFSALCRYDAARFTPEFLLEVMNAHPYMLIDGMVVPSPHFAT